MSLFALTLVLVAAFFHATWNLLAKRVGGGGTLVWLFGALGVLIYAPLAVAVVLVQGPRIGAAELLFVFGSGVLHLGYFLMLQRGYATGDLSLVYPLARGTGPLIATTAAIAFMGERPTLLALSGVVLIGGGVFSLTKGPGWFDASGRSAVYGFLTGLFIAAYTLWDKHAVGPLAIPPLLMSWGQTFVSTALLTPFALRRREDVRSLWSRHRVRVIGVAVLIPLSYILVLTALSFTPVSYVAPAREISILLGVVMGARLLSEEDVSRRLLAAGAMVLGIVALALG